jgi:hypothetical protein
MAKQFSLTAAAYKLVWVRVVLFYIAPVLIAFVASDMSDDKWKALGELGKWKYIAAINTPGILSLMAFLDKSMARAGEKADKLKAEHAIATMDPREAP